MLKRNSMATSQSQLDEARCDMAAMFRIAVMENLHEGIDNHFSYMLDDGTFLVNRWGVHWSEMCRSDILRIDSDGNVLDGDGMVEPTAFYIHEAVHRLCPGARAVLHTHMPYATALSCAENGFNDRLSQNALMFYGSVAYETYNGLAMDKDEGERLAQNISGNTVAVLENHGVLVMAKSMGIAMHSLYFFERAAQVQVLAESTGRQLKEVPLDIAEHTANQMDELDEEKETYFAVMKRLLDTNQPEYRR